MSFNAAPVATRVLACFAVLAAVVLLVPSSSFGAALGRRTLVQGMSGNDVRALQTLLTRAGFATPVAGNFGSITLRNVKRFQRRHRLTVDGIVGPQVVRKLRAIAKRRARAQSTRRGVRRLGDRVLRLGARGRDVRVLQDYLGRAGFATAIDGVFGRGTLRMVKRFQRSEGLPVTGVVAELTVAALRRIGDGAEPTAGESEAADDAAQRTAAAGGASADTAPVSAPIGRAKLLANGLAVPPADAPQVVKDVIEAGNEIATKPYKYGGGHGRWIDTGYDCSGSVSYALYRAGLLRSSMPSGGFMNWGDKGKGKWITIYAHGGHMYMVVAGLRFDTSGARPSRWQSTMRSAKGFAVRHPRGL